MSTVVIVGRKNVGKSTIFNRLTGMKVSIVYKEPGVTRDRIFGEAHWRGRVFDVIDTGGFAPDEESGLAGKINKQIEFALADADLIYFVVDGKTGLMPGDEEIGNRLRKLNKAVFILVNKIDTKKDETKSWEFAKLGFSDLFTVSAEAGIGFGEILDMTTKMLPRLRRLEEADEIIRVLILGRPNSGKSTLMNSIVKEERAIVDEKPGTTRDLVNAKFSYRNKDIELIDTCGMRRRSRIKEPIEFYSMIRAMRMIERADVAILVFDVTQGVVEQDSRIASFVLAKAKSLIIAPNKIDLINKKDIGKVTRSTTESFEFIDFVPIIPISAKSGVALDKLLNSALDVYNEAAKVVDKGVMNTLFEGLKPPAHGSILKLSQIGHRPPVFKAVVSTSVKENYIKYLRHSIRSYFGFSGVPILIRTNVISRH